MEIYLDNSATTRPFDEVIQFMGWVQHSAYGNPSSAHALGLEAEKLLREARDSVALALGCRSDEIIFTSGGTEANNLAIKGAAYRNRRRGNHIITTAIEHPSVLNCCRKLEQEGFIVDYLPVDGEGYVNLERLKQALTGKTILVSIIHVNNEIGTVQPLEIIGSIIKNRNPDTLFHVDGVQSLAKVPLALDRWQADLFSCSAHKIHGPKGTGALMMRRKTLLHPLFEGGDQEKGLRPGTENVTGVAGFGMAARITMEKMHTGKDLMCDLKEILLKGLQEAGLEVGVNGPPSKQSAPHLLNIRFPGVKGEILLRVLEQHGIYASAGSACHSRHPKSSYVLQEIGVNTEDAASSLRFSFSGFNTFEEIQTVIARTVTAVKELRQLPV